MSLSDETIDLAYRLFLGRAPSPGCLAHVRKSALTFEELRMMLIRSREFARVYEAARRPVPDRPGGLPTLVHLHIPKTAGTSLNDKLLPLYRPDERIDAHAGDITRRLREMPSRDRARLRLIAGHCAHGIHRLLTPPVLYMVILRRPGARIYSYYRFIMRTAVPPELQGLVDRQPDFGDFLMMADEVPSLRIELDNGQVRRIAGHMGEMTVDGAMLDKAWRHMMADDLLFGLTENFGAFLECLAERGILPDATPLRANAAPKAARFEAARAALTPDQADRLARFTHWDDLLYARAAAHLSGTESLPDAPALPEVAQR